MNDKIKQYSDEAHQFALDTIEYGQEFGDIWSQKFAELMVKECMTIAQEYDGAKLGGPGMIIAMRIEQHFGVEE